MQIFVTVVKILSLRLHSQNIVREYDAVTDQAQPNRLNRWWGHFLRTGSRIDMRNRRVASVTRTASLIAFIKVRERRFPKGSARSCRAYRRSASYREPWRQRTKERKSGMEMGSEKNSKTRRKGENQSRIFHDDRSITFLLSFISV